jgi:hypothetical protein
LPANGCFGLALFKQFVDAVVSAEVKDTHFFTSVFGALLVVIVARLEPFFNAGWRG